MSCNLYYKNQSFISEAELEDYIKNEVEQLSDRLDKGRLTFEERNHIENVGASILNTIYEENINFSNSEELKKEFIEKYNNALGVLTPFQETFNGYVLKDIQKEKSLLWDRIKVISNKKYSIDKKSLNEFEEGLNSTKEWDDSKRLSRSAATGMDDVKIYINSLDKMIFDEDGNPTYEKDTPTGINNKLDFNKVLGTLIHDLYSENISEFESKIANLSKRIPSFMQLYQDISTDKGLKNRLFSKLKKQTPQSYAVLYKTDNKGKVKDINNKVENLASYPDIQLSDLWITNSKNIVERKSLSKSIGDINNNIISIRESVLNDNFRTVALKLKEIYDVVGISTSVEDIFNSLVYNKPDINKVETLYLQPVKHFIKNYKKNTFDSTGYYNQLAKLINDTVLEKGESTYLNVSGNKRVTGFDSSFLSDFFHKMSDPSKAKALLKEHFNEISMTYSNLIPFLIKDYKIENKKIIDFEINEENLAEFNYFLYGGNKNENTRQAREYKDFLLDNFAMSELMLYLKPNAKENKENKGKLISFNLPTPSDGSNMFAMNYFKTPLYVDEFKTINTGDLKEIQSTTIFNSFFNVARQEIFRMDDAYNLMSDYITEERDVNGVKIISDNNLPLVKDYHYKISKDSKGKKVKVLGNVFNFNNFSWRENGVEKTLNDYSENFDHIRRQDLAQNGKATILQNNLKNGVAKFIYHSVEENRIYYSTLENKFNEDLFKDYESYGHFITEFALNRFLFDVEFSNLLGGNLAQYKKLQEYFKRAKQTVSFGMSYAFNEKDNSYLAATLESIIKDIDIGGKIFEGVDTTDGISIISEANYNDRLERLGEQDKTTIVPQKNFYYDYTYDPQLKKFIGKQVKNSELVAKKSVFKGTDFEEIIDFLEELEEEFGTYVQLNFDSAEKLGTREINKISDGKKVILTDAVREKIRNSLTEMTYSGLKKQLDTVVHSKDETNKFGTQVARELTSNINEKGSYSIGSSSLSGKVLKTHTNKLRSLNVQEASKMVLEELKKGNENFTDKEFSQMLIDSGIESGLDNNSLEAMLLDEQGRFRLPLSFFSSVKSKQFATSIFTKGVTNQYVSGLHLAQQANVFISSHKKHNQLTEIDKENIIWAKDYDSTTGLKAAAFEKSGTIVAEVILPAFTENMVNSDGTLDIESLDEKARTMLGYRVPTEGKYSMYVFKVVGFFPQDYESAIVLPDDWVALSGSDFDIDSVFIQRYNLDSDNKVVEYLDENSSLEDRAKLFKRYKKNELDSKTFKSFTTKLKNTYEKQKEQRSDKKDFIKSVVTQINNAYETDFTNSRDAINYLKETKRTISAYINNNQRLLKIKTTSSDSRSQELKAEIIGLKEQNKTIKDFLNVFYNTLKENKELSEQFEKIQESNKKGQLNAIIKEIENLSIEEQNPVVARNNRLLDIAIGVWTSKHSQAEILESSNFKQVQEAVKDFTKGTYHPFNNVDRLNMTSLLMSGRDLKGIFVNYVGLNKLANSINGVYLNTPVKVKLSKSQIKEYGLENIKKHFKEDFNEETNVLKLRVIGDNLAGTNTNINGKLVTSFQSQLVANVLDIAKYPMTPNTNTQTAGVLSILPSLGYPDYHFGFNLIEQQIVQQYVNAKYEKELDSNSSSSAKYQILSDKQTKLNNLIEKKKSLTSNKRHTPNKKNIYISNKEDASKKFGLNEDFVPSVDDLKKILEAGKNYRELSLDGKINYIKSQLSIFYYYEDLERLASKADTLARVTSYDKIGAGPDFNTTKSLANSFNNLLEEDIFTTRDKKSIEDIVNNVDGVYPVLAAFKTFSNDLAYNTFSEFYLTEKEPITNLVAQVPDSHKNKFEQYVVSTLLKINPFFADITVEESRRIIGLLDGHTSFKIDGEFDQETYEKFTSLPVANKLTLVKEQIADLNDDKNMLLNYIAYNPQRSGIADPIDIYKNDQTDVLVYSFREMLKSENPYIKDLAYDLIRYTYITDGLNFGINLTKYIPVDLFYSTGIYDIDINIADTLRSVGIKMKSSNPLLTIGQELVENFYKSNHKNIKLVPIIQGDFWKEFNTYGVKTMSFENYSKLNPKLQTPVLKFKNSETRAETLVKRHFKTDLLGNVTDVIFYPTNKLERYEFGNHSYNSLNNIPVDFSENKSKEQNKKNNQILFDTLDEPVFSEALDTSARDLIAKGYLDAETDAARYDFKETKQFLGNSIKQSFDELSFAGLRTYILSAIKANTSMITKLPKPLSEMDATEMRRFIFNEIEGKFVSDAKKLYRPMKSIQDLNDEELRQSLVDVFTYRAAKLEWYEEELAKITDVNSLLNSNESKEKLSRLLYSINIHMQAKDDFNNLRYFKDTDSANLTKEQARINNIILHIQKLTPREDAIKVIYDKILKEYYKSLYFKVTTNEAILNAENKDKAFDEIFKVYEDIGEIALQLDTPYANSDSFISAMLKHIKDNIEEERVANYGLKKHWSLVSKALKDRNIDRSLLFKKDTKGNNVGAFDMAFIDAFVPELANFLKSLGVKVRQAPSEERRFFANGMVPAYALDARSKKVKILEDIFSFYDNDSTSSYSIVEDRKGTKLNGISFKGLKPIKKKHIIELPPYLPDEKFPHYEQRVLEELSLTQGLNFKNLDEIKKYNKAVKAYNEKLVDPDNPALNISYDLDLIIPRFLDELSSSVSRKKSLQEFQLLINHLKSSEFIPARKGAILDKYSKLRGKTTPKTLSGEVSNTVKQLEWLLDNEFYEESNRSEEFATKYGRVLRNYTSLRGLGLNLFSGINNIAYGELMTRIEAWAKDELTPGAWKQAGKLYRGKGLTAMASYIIDTAREDGSASTKQSAWFRFFDVLHRQNERPENYKENAKERVAQGDIGRMLYKNSSLYVLNGSGEHYMQNRLLLAMSLAYKVVNGKAVSFNDFLKSRLHKIDKSLPIEEKKKLIKENKEIKKVAKEEFESYTSVYDSIEFKEGFLDLDSSKLSEREIGKFRDKVVRKNHKLHGIYNQEDQSLITSVELGRHALMFRKWARPGWVKRFGTSFLKDKGYNEFTGRRDMGTYSELWKFLKNKSEKPELASEYQELMTLSALKIFMKDFGNLLAHLPVHYNSLSLEEKMRVSSAVGEITSMIVVSALLGITKYIGSDDDELKENMAYNMTLYQLERLKTETLTYLPGYGWLNEGLKLASTPTATFGTTTLLFKLMTASYYTAIGSDKAIYRGGIYRNRYKAAVYGEKLIPLYTQWLRLKYIKKHNKAFKLI